MPDLWPQDIATTELTPPVTLLKEQGTLLGEKTKNLVVGKVVRLDDWSYAQPGHFAYAFYLVAPALGNYRYKLLTLSYPPEFYPLCIDVDEDVFRETPAKHKREGSAYTPPTEGTSFPGLQISIMRRPHLYAESEEAYKEILSAIFDATKTRTVVAAIVAQSTS